MSYQGCRVAVLLEFTEHEVRQWYILRDIYIWIRTVNDGAVTGASYPGLDREILRGGVTWQYPRSGDLIHLSVVSCPWRETSQHSVVYSSYTTTHRSVTQWMVTHHMVGWESSAFNVYNELVVQETASVHDCTTPRHDSYRQHRAATDCCTQGSYGSCTTQDSYGLYHTGQQRTAVTHRTADELLVNSFYQTG